VAEIPLTLQGKLLRVLQEGEFERLGEEQTRRVDVRIIAATNRPLQRDVESGRFRQDLYYRLNVFPIAVVPLREHEEDIPLLTKRFLEQVAARMKLRRLEIPSAEMAKLQEYTWPGNVRELQNVIEHAVITARDGVLRFQLPNGDAQGLIGPNASRSTQVEVLSDTQMSHRQRENIVAALQRAGGKVYGPGGAAALLGVKPTTLASRIKRLGLRCGRYGNSLARTAPERGESQET